MKDIDTALVDALVKSITEGSALNLNFACSCAAMQIPLDVSADQRSKLNNKCKEMESWAQPKKTLAFLRLLKKLLESDRGDEPGKVELKAKL